MSEEPKSGSKNDNQWVSALIDEAKNNNPLVADCVFTKLEVMLKGSISEGGLTPTQLKTMATQLIEGMVPNSPQPEEKQ